MATKKRRTKKRGARRAKRNGSYPRTVTFRKRKGPSRLPETKSGRTSKLKQIARTAASLRAKGVSGAKAMRQAWAKVAPHKEVSAKQRANWARFARQYGRR